MAERGDLEPIAARVLLSGGIDSAACAHFLAAQGYRVRGIFVEFGQAAQTPERLAIERISKSLGIQTSVIQARGLGDFGAGELLGRNAFLIFAAMLLGGTHRGLLAIGVHSGTPYFDCSLGFIDRMKSLVEEHTAGRLTVAAPFLSWSKGQVYDYALSAGLPIDVTYSCEAGTTPPCGECASCRDRRELGC